MHGFTKCSFTDHTLSAFLAKHNALDNYRFLDATTNWSTPNGRVLVVALYGEGTDVTYWVRNDSVPA